MTIHMNLGHDSYDILVERGILARAKDYLNLNRRVLVVTDTQVPAIYAQTLAAQCQSAVICTVETGENSKSLGGFGHLLQTMLDHGFSRKDCVVAVGGGVVGDLSGFAASAYMRGIDFYNIPTTVLSQVDSSIGGKTAIDFGGYKNLVGAFWPPKGVLIDSNVLQTLSKRHVSNGLSEAVKMALTHDADLLDTIAKADGVTDEIILGALKVKKLVVEADERECGLRKVLNFGHTLGHAIESVYDMQTYYHGECVALGMLPMCAPTAKEKLLPVLRKLNLPTEYSGDVEALIEACRHDTKAAGDTITIVYVPTVGSFEMKTIAFSEYEEMIKDNIAN